jgi:hypothetical protein
VLPTAFRSAKERAVRIGALAAVVATLVVVQAADPTYAEWASERIDAFLAGDLDVNSEGRFSWHHGRNGAWTAGIAFVRSTTHGDGIVVVPDAIDGLAYLAFTSQARYVTTAEAHALGFGFCPYLTTQPAATAILLEPDAENWVLAK